MTNDEILLAKRKSVTCEKCQQRGLVLESKIIRDRRGNRRGYRRRRYECKRCHHRWTNWYTIADRLLDSPPRLEKQKASGAPSVTQRRLTDEEVLFILQNQNRSLESVARELGVSRETVRNVRRGTTYSGIHPRIRRQKPKRNPVATVISVDSPSCWRCTSWVEGRCKEGFPDPEIEGPTFAADCDFYEARRENA